MPFRGEQYRLTSRRLSSSMSVDFTSSFKFKVGDLRRGVTVCLWNIRGRIRLNQGML